MRVVFRTDSSLRIGTGHLMRCLTLADELARRGHSIRFVCRDLKGNVASVVREHGHPLAMLPFPPSSISTSTDSGPAHAAWLGVTQEGDAAQTLDALERSQSSIDWLVVDHYAVDVRWERRLRSRCARIMVIDDLADRLHDCDLLLDQNLYPTMEARYAGLVPTACRTLLGPRFALLRPEFAAARRSLRARADQVRRVQVLFGGVDIKNETLKALEALSLAGNRQLTVDVVIGRSNPHRERLQSYCEGRPGFWLHVQTERVAELIAEADLGIGGGGVATWERCALGLPTLVIAQAHNQEAIAEAAAGAGAIRYLGAHSQVQVEGIALEIGRLVNAPEWRARISQCAANLVDAQGTDRVAATMDNRL